MHQVLAVHLQVSYTHDLHLSSTLHLYHLVMIHVNSYVLSKYSYSWYKYCVLYTTSSYHQVLSTCCQLVLAK